MFVAIDTETDLIGPGRAAPQLVCVSAAGHLGSGPVLLAELYKHDDDDLEPFLRGLLQDDEVTLVAHNAAFDFLVLMRAFPRLQWLIWDKYTRGKVWCSMVAEQLIAVANGWTGFDPRTQKRHEIGLSACSKVYRGSFLTGKGDDSWRMRYMELYHVPLAEWPADASAYAKVDAIAALEVAIEQQAMGDAEPDIYRRTRAHLALNLMASWGFRTDPVQSGALAKDLTMIMEQAKRALVRTGVYRDDGTKDTEAIRTLVERSYHAQGLQPPTTPKGHIQTGADVLRESKNPVLVELAAIASTSKLLSTYVPLLRRGTELPICPRYDAVKVTGRSGCSKPALQNLPRDGGVRECFVPRPGMVYIQADYSIAELRALAQILIWLFGQSDIADALIAGKDLHIATAAQMLGITYADAMERYRAGDQQVTTTRRLGKVYNFLVAGGGGGARIAAEAKNYGVDMTPAEADAGKQQWLDIYPEMRRYFKRVGALARGGSFTLTQPVSGRLRGDVGFTDGCNSPFQGLVADFALDALFHVMRECYIDPQSPLYGARGGMFGHDEIILEVAAARAPAAAARLSEIMVRRAERWVPDIPHQAEPVIMRRWNKGAEPAYHEGTLVPAEDLDRLAREQVERSLHQDGIIEDPSVDGGLRG